jgi:phosphoribosylformimino-5-aminoimidazole carboxamide ribotide isomerase
VEDVMLVIPAIDLMGGRVVRLVEGRREWSTVYSDRPAEIARAFVAAGARRIHVVDLDGAFSGARENREAVAAILATGAEVQVGGGVRDVATAKRLLSDGAAAVVVGTLAARDPDAFLREEPELLRRTIVAVDARDGRVVVEGWERDGGIDAAELAARVAPHVAGVLYTDVARDGRGTGANVTRSAEFARAIAPTPLIASGGIGSLDDLRALARAGIPACVVGRALYDNKFTLPEALEAGSLSGVACP